MFTITGYIITSVFWGVLISSILTGLLFYLPKTINVRYNYSLPYALLLCIMFIFFVFQGSLLVGAVKFRKGVRSTEHHLLSTLKENKDYALVSLSDFGFIQKEKSEQVSRPDESPEAYIRQLGNEVRHEMTIYIWRRIGWIVGGILVTILLLARNANRTNRRNIPVRKRYDDLVY